MKSARIPETAKAKAGNDDVPLNKIRVIVNKLDAAKKKTLGNGIRNLNSGFDPDTSVFDAFDIQLVDQYGNTVTVTEGKVRILLAFPSTLTKKYTNYYYFVYHQKTEGGVERIPNVKYSSQGVWFDGDKFSPFGLVALEKSGGEPSPGTGETILFTVLALVLLGLAAGAIVLIVMKGRRGAEDDQTEEESGSGE